MRSWTTEEEIALFNLVCDHKPAGAVKHKQMDAIIDNINKDVPGSNKFTVADIWAKLATLYDLKRIDYLEDWESESSGESSESETSKKEQDEKIKVEEDKKEDKVKGGKTKEVKIEVPEVEEDEVDEVASPVPEPIKKTTTTRSRSREPRPRRQLRNMTENSGDESSGLSDVESKKEDKEKEEDQESEEEEEEEEEEEQEQEEEEEEEEEEVEQVKEEPKQEEQTKPRRGRRGRKPKAKQNQYRRKEPVRSPNSKKLPSKHHLPNPERRQSQVHSLHAEEHDSSFKKRKVMMTIPKKSLLSKSISRSQLNKLLDVLVEVDELLVRNSISLL
ncbi:uncharacterized protein SPAPADRAFT_59681 [Spathaspora passalidarum NRRL Y-27907]|uniref:Uncharacterized protein n=1 Tax=Spathaspora passalidarum (strain NRRL Y-27907 / 11-Y1) TaxID=619300 RepID=G3AHU3_SPAPN|nr:uncharacterized protein SPAPADRAFT_59681 [Spathaspora passalidarum NRRL Y-27907]EGW34257.1 hypothetical protein SPAPADRAFT_59681 [Spathaspora passalidarum NRRL Y-27907]